MTYRKIKGQMPDGNYRYVQLDYEGRTLVSPRGFGTLKTVETTKAIVGGSEGANDVLSESTTAGTAWHFMGVSREKGGKGYIVKAQAISESESVTPQLTLFLFARTPTSNLNDNVANTAPDIADRDFYLGKIDFPAMESLGTTDSNSIVTPSTYGNLPLEFECVHNSQDLYGILATRTAFTQTAGDDITIKLTTEQYS